MTTPDKLTPLRMPKVPDGMERGYYKCRVCGEVYYRDFVPYSTSNPIWTIACGHNIGMHFGDVMETITKKKFDAAFRKQHGAKSQ